MVLELGCIKHVRDFAELVVRAPTQAVIYWSDRFFIFLVILAKYSFPKSNSVQAVSCVQNEELILIFLNAESFSFFKDQ